MSPPKSCPVRSLVTDLTCKSIVRSDGIYLSLLRDRISLVCRSREGDAPHASDRRAWVDTQIPPEGGRAGIGYRRGPQYREILRRTQKWRRQCWGGAVKRPDHCQCQYRQDFGASITSTPK